MTAPVLTDENSQVATGYSSHLDERYIGTYKNDIITEENGAFVKIGERVLTITSCENGKVSGSYTEIYKPGYEQDAVLRVKGCLYAHFTGPMDHSSLASQKLNIYAYEHEIELTGTAYSIYVNQDSENGVMDVFMETK